MLQALRIAQASRPAFRSTAGIRSLSTTPCIRSAGPPLLYGAGAAPGAVPTDEEQATGLERLQLLGKMEGVDVFNMKKPEATKKGTMENPIRIPSLVRQPFHEQIIRANLYHRLNFVKSDALVTRKMNTVFFGSICVLVGRVAAKSVETVRPVLYLPSDQFLNGAPVFEMDYQGPEEADDHH
jgi:Cytochrome c oxidase subunit Vb